MNRQLDFPMHAPKKMEVLDVLSMIEFATR
jgi:hypothetical protein